MKPLLLLALLFTGCAYSGPKLQLQAGFMGFNAGVTIGSDVPTVALPATKGLAK